MKKSIARILFVFMIFTIGTLGLIETVFRILFEVFKWLIGKDFNEDAVEDSILLNFIFNYMEKYV